MSFSAKTYNFLPNCMIKKLLFNTSFEFSSAVSFFFADAEFPNPRQAILVIMYFLVLKYDVR